MEVTLEKIELVKDRTGVTYKEAKEALEAADGNVVDAIVAIEDKADGQTQSEKLGATGGELLDKMKEIVRRGNIARIIVKKDDEKLLNLPLNAGVVGAVIAPWGVILGACAAFGFKCKIEFVKDDGSVIDITDKAGNLYEDVLEKGGQMVDQVKEKAPGVYDTVREKGEAAVNKAQEVAKDARDKFASGKDKAAGAVSEQAEDVIEQAEDLKKDIEEGAEKAAEDASEAAKDADPLNDIKDEDL